MSNIEVNGLHLDSESDPYETEEEKTSRMRNRGLVSENVSLEESSANRSTSIEGNNLASNNQNNRVVDVDENFKKYMSNLHRYMETGTIKTPPEVQQSS